MPGLERGWVFIFSNFLGSFRNGDISGGVFPRRLQRPRLPPKLLRAKMCSNGEWAVESGLVRIVSRISYAPSIGPVKGIRDCSNANKLIQNENGA
jgi:hypothetical protein